MKKIVLVQSAVIAALICVLLLVAFNPVSSGSATVAFAQGGDDDTPPPARSIDQPVAPAAPNATPTTTVYFNPQDNTNNGTVVILYNTTAVTQTVVVKSYWSLGVLYGPWNVSIGPYGLAHLVTDSLAANPPASWTNTTYTNFTDSTNYATLDVPAGVHVDGYIVFNSTTGTIDPNVYQDAIPLRFSTDPYTVLLPAINR